VGGGFNFSVLFRSQNGPLPHLLHAAASDIGVEGKEGVVYEVKLDVNTTRRLGVV
jgi:hypothetical protein